MVTIDTPACTYCPTGDYDEAELMFEFRLTTWWTTGRHRIQQNMLDITPVLFSSPGTYIIFTTCYCCCCRCLLILVCCYSFPVCTSITYFLNNCFVCKPHWEASCSRTTMHLFFWWLIVATFPFSLCKMFVRRNCYIALPFAVQLTVRVASVFNKTFTWQTQLWKLLPSGDNHFLYELPRLI